jgi:hypothetical protein
MEKQCSKCKLCLSIENFGKKKIGYQSFCKKCATEVSKIWYIKNSQDKKTKKILNERASKSRKAIKTIIDCLKSDFGCAICRENDACCLDFHHPDHTSKHKDVAHWVRCNSLENIVLEICKCVCVCANCHRKIHAHKITCPLISHTAEQIINKIKEYKKNNN